MKRGIHLVVISMSMIFFGCDTDDSQQTNSVSDNLIGLWSGSNVTFTIKTNFFQDGNSFSRTCTSSYLDSDYLIEFMANPKTFMSSGDFFVETVCDDLDAYYEEFSLFGDGQWEVMNSELQFTAPEDQPQGEAVSVSYREIDIDLIELTSERIQTFVDGDNYAEAVFTVVVELTRQ